MTYVKSSPKSTPSQANELQDSLLALFDAIWNVILYAQVWNTSFQYFFHAFIFNPPQLFPFAPETILFCSKNKNIFCGPFTSSQGDRCEDVILHHWNQGSAAVEWKHRHIKLMLQKDTRAFTSQWSFCSVPSGTHHPPLLTSTARAEGKWLFTGYSSTRRATADTYAVPEVACFIFMQCMTESSWSSEVSQDLKSHPFKRSSLSMSILKAGALYRTYIAATFCTSKCRFTSPLCACCWAWGALETH